MKIVNQRILEVTREKLHAAMLADWVSSLSNPIVFQESTRICPGCKVERDFVDDVNGLRTTCKTCRGTWDAFDEMFAV